MQNFKQVSGVILFLSQPMCSHIAPIAIYYPSITAIPAIRNHFMGYGQNSNRQIFYTSDWDYIWAHKGANQVADCKHPVKAYASLFLTNKLKFLVLGAMSLLRSLQVQWLFVVLSKGLGVQRIHKTLQMDRHGFNTGKELKKDNMCVAQK